MPRENRKRGKKHRKSAVQDPDSKDPAKENEHDEPDQPSWIVAKRQKEMVDFDAPFGYVEPDVKAYFRTVDEQIKFWQDNRPEGDKGQDTDPNEERRLFFVAALTEMADKERQLATDPDCSIILERMTYSMDDFVRRVFMDKLAGSYEIISRHRFASHVCQTLFTVVTDTITRECRGIFPVLPDAQDQGELRTMTQLILDVCEELKPSFTSLIMDAFASHVIRALLLILSPRTSTNIDIDSLLRSKKSAKWKARQAPLKPVFMDGSVTEPRITSRPVPDDFTRAARNFVQVLRDELSANEVRALAASKAASPVLRLLLEIEVDQGMNDEPDSLMDQVMMGIITACRNGPESFHEPSDYINTLLRDATSSHLLETLVSHSPDDAFCILWSNYFKGKLARLVCHPVANFIVAKALDRVSISQLVDSMAELQQVWGKVIKLSRVGVLRSMIDRAVSLGCLGTEVEEAVLSAFELHSLEDRRSLVSCALSLLPLPDYKAALTIAEEGDRLRRYKKHCHKEEIVNIAHPKVQGAVLLQSMLRLPEPHNQTVIDSVLAMPVDERIKMAQHPISSRVLDVFFDSTTVQFKYKRQLVLSFIGHIHLLVDDRIGSRIGDRCWALSDTYLKEKIARSLIPHESSLVASQYGKYFSRNLNLYLLQRRPEEWKNLQSTRKQGTQQLQTELNPTASSTQLDGSRNPVNDTKKRKQSSRLEDEIDAVFNASLGKRIKKGALGVQTSIVTPTKPAGEAVILSKGNEQTLSDILGAIRSAPKESRGHKNQTKKGR